MLVGRIVNLEQEGKPQRALTAYFTMVALDRNARPKSVPPLILDTEEAKRASALAAVGSLSGQRNTILAQIAEQQSLKSDASQRVFEAQNALDLATANGNRAGIGTASSALADAKTNAQNVGAAADRVLADLSASLKNIEQRLNAASNYLKQQNSQSSYAWAEAPAGD